MNRVWLRRTVVLAVTTIIGVTGFAEVARAAGAIVWVESDPRFGDTMVYMDSPGPSESHVVVRSTATGFQLDEVYGVQAGTGCVHPTPSDLSLVTCTVSSAGSPGVTLRLGDGNDFADVLGSGPYATAPTLLDGGPGDDTLYGNNGIDKLIGGPGNDLVWGRGGNDGIREGPGADRDFGGAGNDTVSYFSSPVGVVASLNGVAGDDGAPGEGDTIASDVESLEGSRFDDTISGNDGPNALGGCDGNDHLYGLGGNDVLDGDDAFAATTWFPVDLFGACYTGVVGTDVMDGGDGIDSVRYFGRTVTVVVDLDDSAVGDDGQYGELDTVLRMENVYGGAATDILIGDSAANVIRGMQGNDIIAGQDGDDALFGDDGDDRILGGNGADTIDGGPGTDVCDLGPGGASTTACAP